MGQHQTNRFQVTNQCRRAGLTPFRLGSPDMTLLFIQSLIFVIVCVMAASKMSLPKGVFNANLAECRTKENLLGPLCDFTKQGAADKKNKKAGLLRLTGDN